MTAPTISGTQHIANRLNAPESVHTPTPIDRIAGRLALVGAKVREDIHNRFSSSDEVQTEMSEAHNLWGNQIIRSAADFGSSDVPNIKQLYKASKLVHNVLEPAGLFEGASEQGIRLNEADVAKALKSVSPERGA